MGLGRPTTGYGVQINRIARQGDTVTIYAQFREPNPDEERADMVTSPYHLVRVKKVGTWEGDISFNLVVGGGIAASLSRRFP